VAGWKPPTAADRTLGIVDFSICPHVAQENMPGNSMAEAESWAADIPNPAYAIDRPDRHEAVDDRR
jgi:dipeptidase E